MEKFYKILIILFYFPFFFSLRPTMVVALARFVKGSPCLVVGVEPLPNPMMVIESSEGLVALACGW